MNGSKGMYMYPGVMKLNSPLSTIQLAVEGQKVMLLSSSCFCLG